MEKLLFFITGTISAWLIFPIIQYINELFYCIFELVKSHISIKITRNNCKIDDLQKEMCEENSNVIGFSLPSKYDEDCDYEECKHRKVDS